jgi:hypothetical protein
MIWFKLQETVLRWCKLAPRIPFFRGSCLVLTNRTSSLDEFYSWYQYDPELEGKSVSAAAYIDGERIQQLNRKFDFAFDIACTDHLG